MDLLIVGAGLSGAVIANKAAKAGKKVLVIEQREHVGGNVYDKEIDGVTTHMYGPHIFHTNSERAYKFMNSFWKLNSYKNRVEGEVAGRLVPIPFNFRGIDRFWPEEAEEIKRLLMDKYGKGSRVSISELAKQDDEVLKEVAEFVYKNVFENYTVKMWGLEPKDIDKSVMDRVPVVIGYEERYFSDKYEGIPEEGYTAAIEKMLSHRNIEVKVGIDAAKSFEKKDSKIFFEDLEVTCPIVYSGRLDELFDYEYGILDYRSLNIQFETVEAKQFQGTAVVNYPAHPRMTRITEYKKMTFEESDKTVISREYPGKYDPDSDDFNVPFYPNPTDESRKGYEKYVKLLSAFENVYPVGRLATYKYLNMDQAIEAALDLAEKIIG